MATYISITVRLQGCVTAITVAAVDCSLCASEERGESYSYCNGCSFAHRELGAIGLTHAVATHCCKHFHLLQIPVELHPEQRQPMFLLQGRGRGVRLDLD